MPPYLLHSTDETAKAGAGSDEVTIQRHQNNGEPSCPLFFGPEGSSTRKHADEVRKSFIDPALKARGVEAFRAD
jgi:hypothetical protein